MNICLLGINVDVVDIRIVLPWNLGVDFFLSYFTINKDIKKLIVIFITNYELLIDKISINKVLLYQFDRHKVHSKNSMCQKDSIIKCLVILLL